MNHPPYSASAFSNNEAFKLSLIKHGNGREAVHVALDQWVQYPSSPSEILLSIDAESFQEFSHQVDNLRAQLDNLKIISKEVFRQIEEDKKSGRV